MTEQQTRMDAGTRAYRPVRRGGGDARLVGGVCAGLGRATGVDPLVYRIAVVSLTVAGGIGVLVYAAGWFLMPNEDQEASLIEGWAGRRYDAADVLAILGAILAAGFVLSLLGGPGGASLVALVVLALGLLTAQRRGVDLTKLARSLPDHVRGRPAPRPADATAPGSAGPAPWAPAATSETAGAAPSPASPALPGAPAPPSPSAPGAGTGTSAAPADSAAEPVTAPLGGTPGAGAGDTRADGLIDLGAYGRGSRTDPPQGGAPYGPGPAAAPPRPRPRGLWLGTLFFLAAAGAGAWAMAINAPVYGWDGTTTIGYGAATALIVLGAGLVVGAWFGRTRSLLGWGVILALALSALPLIGTGSVRTSVEEIDMHWRPRTVAQAAQPVRLGVGAGRLDLTEVPFDPGKPVAVSAEMHAGYFRVTVPRDAEVRIDGAVRFGDIRGDDRVYPSHRGHVRTTLEPLVAPGRRSPVIELRLRGVVGDMEVRRAA